ncbi:carbohydrate-binding protein [Streptomyces sp. I05A-00742]|uniref:carbohydrate-binding protein n=1 Tax=Streptomyces sp. I05A-00742 TaxID=2732853 RepID=UPI0014895528|nr:carbohydrate-binding protein [Streptomyces sp. I05A-00742]
MTAGNNGNGKPEEEDPFGYLYRSEGGDQGADASASAPQPGVPRTSYNQVRPVGSRQYTPQPGGTYGAGAPAPQQPPAPHYAAPETLPGGAPRQPGPPPGGHGGHGGDAGRPKRRGLLIAAISVVVVVAGGIAAAVITNMGDGDEKNSTNVNADKSPSPNTEDKKKDQKKGGEDKPSGKPVKDLKRDAASLRLGGGATTSTDVKNAPTEGGLYVAMKQGSSIEWGNVDVKDGGQYTVWVDYGAQSGEAGLSLWVNGQKLDTTVNLKKWPGDGWSYTYNYVQLKAGKNDVKLSCDSQCNVNVARLKVLSGWYKSKS